MKVKERKVNAEFIEKKLIPFVLREQGRGFQMAQWIERVDKDGAYYNDDLDKTIKSPGCGTAACIGGSVQVLQKGLGRNHEKMAKFLGLTNDQANGLFYEWSTWTTEPFHWPLKFAEAFAMATTPYRKAQVAVRLLREVVRTNGDCLGSNE